MCQLSIPGDFINWRAGNYSIVGNVTLVKSGLTITNICKPTISWRKVITVKQSAREAKNLCQKINGSHSVIRDKEEEEDYSEFIKDALAANEEVKESCNYVNEGSQYGPSFVLAQHKQLGPLETSPVRDPYTGDIINYTNWYTGWPNGNFLDKGSYWLVFKYKYGDSSFIHRWDTQPFCFTCDGQDTVVPIVRMRGLCEESQFDKNYILASNHRDVLFYQGDRHTNISYDHHRERWVMVSNRRVEKSFIKDDPVLAYSKVNKYSRIHVKVLGQPMKGLKHIQLITCRLHSQAFCLVELSLYSQLMLVVVGMWLSPCQW